MYLILETAAAAVLLFFPILLLKHTLSLSWKRAGFFLLFSVYLAGVWTVVGLPNVTYIRMDANISLVPFRDMLDGWVSTVLNVVLFMPLGVFLPLLWKPFSDIKQAACFGFFLSLAIELLQIFTFRATDINDLITNTLGTLLGWYPGCIAMGLLSGLSTDSSRRELTAIVVCTAAVMFFVHPLLINLISI